MPNGRSVYTFLKRKETVICMSQRNGTVVSEQALKVSHAGPLIATAQVIGNKNPSVRREFSIRRSDTVGPDNGLDNFSSATARLT